jgi:hypothetical protein
LPVAPFAIALVSTMSAWNLRRTRARREQTKPRSSGTQSPAAIDADAGSAAVDITPPEDHFRRLRPGPDAPPLASIVARSLPLIGILGVVGTVALAIGSARGELPLIGAIDTGTLTLALALLTISVWAVYLLWKVPQWQADAWARTGTANPRELFEIENASRGTLGQILSGVAVLTGLIFAWQQLGNTSDNLRVSEEGQITDRFTRAVDQLGSDDFTVRLGGIYALERIARDSPRDYGPVMEVLTAFVRQEAPLPVAAAATPAASVPAMPPEVEAVLKVIGRRSSAQIASEIVEGRCLDLTGITAVGADLAGYDLRHTCWDRSDLRGAALARANLRDTTFDRSDLTGANLDGVDAQGAALTRANLTAANLSRANLSDANFLAADLTGATLQETNLSRAELIGTNLAGALLFGVDLGAADLADAQFTGTILTGATLAGAEHVTVEQLDPAIIDRSTVLPDGIDLQPDL